ncbi:calcium:proton antiporter [Carnimonas bestiolae]|uniref:calcium:proton antiporter n=1 Tax=Carnimonas bestiolae TaxID=3402172 RepID=UPI003EDC2555
MQKLIPEWPLLTSIIAVVAGYSLEHLWLGNGQLLAGLVTVALVLIIIGAAMRVANHAEVLAEKVGDPYGTMILTLSAVLVEVMILIIMMNNEHSPTLGRDTIYSAVMLDMNGIIGLAALLGGFKHGEQVYNDDSSKSYVVMILTAMGVTMVLPRMLPETNWVEFSIFNIAAMVVLYGVFLRMQTGPHSYFFAYNYPDKRKPKQKKLDQQGGAAGAEPHHQAPANLWWSIIVLIVGVVLTGLLAEVMSTGMSVSTKGLPLPPLFVAVVVALISASPEILTALRAALANRMQSVINIALGASLSTVVLTVPVIELISLIQGERIVMALDPLQMTMVGLTLIVAAINLNDGETNAIEGMTHFVLFATFVMLAVMGV